MPSFMIPMAIRYVLVSLGVTVAITAVVTVLIAYGYMNDKPSSLSHLVVMAAGMWAGTYFAKQTGRPAEWRECFRIGAVLMVLQLVLSAVISLGFMMLPGSSFDELTAKLSPGFIGLLIALLAFISLLYWIATAAFIRMGSKSALKGTNA